VEITFDASPMPDMTVTCLMWNLGSSIPIITDTNMMASRTNSSSHIQDQRELVELGNSS
jgi:hypothetical protein